MSPGRASTPRRDGVRKHGLWWKDPSKDSRGEANQPIEVPEEEAAEVSFSRMQEQQQQLESPAMRLTPVKLQKHHHNEAFNSSLQEGLLTFSGHHFPGAQRQRKHPHDTPAKFRESHSSCQHQSSSHHDHHSHHRSLSHRKHHQVLQRKRRSQHRLKKRHQSSLGEGTRRRPLLQFSQSEYRRTVTEDVPLHTSILSVSADIPNTGSRDAWVL